jgi:PAS domain S-box-containing protein
MSPLEAISPASAVESPAAGCSGLSKTALATVLDTLPDVLYVRTVDGELTYWNRALVRLTGYTNDEIAAMRPEEFFVEKDRAAVAEATQQCWEQGSVRVEARVRTKDGRAVPHELSSSVLRDADGTVIGLCGTARDITERIRHEQQRRQSLARLRQNERELRERVKEMTCLLEISKLVDRAQSDLAAILTDVPALLVRAWQYPHVAVARVLFEGDFYASEGFAETPWRQAAPIFVDGRLVGAVEVGYLAPMPEADDGPFLAQEKALLEAVAERLGRIAERIRASHALQESESRFRTIASAAQDAIVLTNENGHIVFWNPAAERMLGYSGDEAVGRDAQKLLGIDDVPVARNVPGFEPGASAGPTIRETDLRAKDGSVVAVEASHSEVWFRGSYCTINLLRDIGRRKQAEEERRRDSQRMDSLLKLHRMGDQPLAEIVRFAVEETIRLTDSTIGYLAVMDEEETTLTMQYWSQSAHASCAMVDKPIVYAIEKTGLWGEAVRQRKPIVTNDYAAPNPHKRGLPDGHVPVVRHMNIPVFEGERIVAVAGVGNKPTDYQSRDVRQLQLFMDGWQHIVQRKQAKEALIEANRAAKAAALAKTQFLANVGHEIRTPLAAILGFNNLLAGELEDPELLETSDTIKRNGEHLLAIINDILDVSKIEAGKIKIDAVKCSPRDIVTEIVALLSGLAEDGGLELSAEYEGPVPETIVTDPVRLRQILTNIVSNAIKFTEAGSVRIVTRSLDHTSDAPQIAFDVIDTGIGIDPAQLERLFEPFTQIDGSDSRKYEGTGLGLAISRRLARKLGGDVTVQSEPERGSTFRITIAAGKSR